MLVAILIGIGIPAFVLCAALSEGKAEKDESDMYWGG